MQSEEKKAEASPKANLINIFYQQTLLLERAAPIVAYM